MKSNKQPVPAPTIRGQGLSDETFISLLEWGIKHRDVVVVAVTQDKDGHILEFVPHGQEDIVRKRISPTVAAAAEALALT